MGPSIEFRNLNLTLGRNRILQDINFKVKPGTIHCIIGPNGGGKTSLLKSLLGQNSHTGEIRITWEGDGKGVIGYVPQMLDFDKTLPITVENFMAIICQKKPAFFSLSSKFRESVYHSLDRVKMKEKRKRKMGDLSGGERQRVLFSQSLMPSPELLILDEPTSGLDEYGEKIFSEIILELKEKGVTTLWINHDLQQVREQADYVTSINKKIQFSGKPKDVLTADAILGIFSDRGE